MCTFGVRVRGRAQFSCITKVEEHQTDPRMRKEKGKRDKLS
jgi:hypothetical protein